MKLSKNRYIDAALKLVLVSGIMHAFLLLIFSIAKLNAAYLNYFNILDVDLFFPSIAKGALSQILSIISIITAYLIIYLYFTKKNQ